MPALMLASGPIAVPAPISIRPSPKITVGGNADHARRRRSARTSGPAGAAGRSRRAARPRSTPPGSRRRRPARRSSLQHGRTVRLVSAHGQRRAPDPDRVALRLPAGRRPVHGRAAARPRRSRGDRAASTATSSSSNEQARGLPSGSEHDVKRAFAELDDDGRRRDHRPVDLRQRADRRAAVRRGPHPRDQLLGRRAHPLAVDVPLPGRLARRGAAGARGSAWSSAACGAPRWCSTSRPSAGATPSTSRRRAAGSGSRSPAPRASRRWPKTRRRPPRPPARRPIPTCSCTSGSACRRAPSRSRWPALGWDVPVLANSALMFGYARPDWRDGYAGWEYIDTIADDNAAARAAAASSRRTPRAVRSAARRTTWAACSAKASRSRST